MKTKTFASYDLSDLYSFDDFVDQADDLEYDADDRGYQSYLENESEYMFDDFCESIGQRIINLKGKVSVAGYNLTWRGGEGKTTFVTYETNPYKAGIEFLRKFLSGYGDFCVEADYIGKYDTQKSFDLSVGHHDGRSFFEIRPCK